jgi:Flp pilus assembly pilin Flp
VRAESVSKNGVRGLFRSLPSDETAQDVIEYALLVALVAVGIALTWSHILGSFISAAFLLIVQQLDTIFHDIVW